MKNIACPPEHRTQRLRVGLIGLAAVMLLIGLAAAIFSTLSHERPVAALGSARPDVVANLVDGNAALPSDTASSAPLVEIGVAPSTGASPANSAAATDPHRR